MWNEHTERGAEIYNRMLPFIDSDDSKFVAKACAYICVEEIMKDAKANWNVDGENYEDSSHFKYWTKVKEEIQKF